MRASRLLSILILLQVRVRLTAEALAQEFGVSVRTIYRDIDGLSAAGIPIYGDRGPGGGFQLLDGYRTRLTGLATDEAQALFMIGLPGPAAALGLGSAAARARTKVLAALSPSLGEDAGRIGARFHLDPVDWYRVPEPVDHLPALARAVLDPRLVSMRYESWRSIRDWQVEPLGLVLKAGAWYVVARGGKTVRIFKVSKILELACGILFRAAAGFRPPRVLVGGAGALRVHPASPQGVVASFTRRLEKVVAARRLRRPGREGIGRAGRGRMGASAPSHRERGPGRLCPARPGTRGGGARARGASGSAAPARARRRSAQRLTGRASREAAHDSSASTCGGTRPSHRPDGDGKPPL